jgi:hypothetical protein
MCDLEHHHSHFGFLVDAPEIRTLVAETARITAAFRDDVDRVAALRPAFAALLAADGWLPEACAQPDATSRMGGGIGQYALARRAGRRRDARPRSPRLGSGWYLPRTSGRDGLSSPR